MRENAIENGVDEETISRLVEEALTQEELAELEGTKKTIRRESEYFSHSLLSIVTVTPDLAYDEEMWEYVRDLLDQIFSAHEDFSNEGTYFWPMSQTVLERIATIISMLVPAPHCGNVSFLPRRVPELLEKYSKLQILDLPSRREETSVKSDILFGKAVRASNETGAIISLDGASFEFPAQMFALELKEFGAHALQISRTKHISTCSQGKLFTSLKLEGIAAVEASWEPRMAYWVVSDLYDINIRYLNGTKVCACLYTHSMYMCVLSLHGYL